MKRLLLAIALVAAGPAVRAAQDRSNTTTAAQQAYEQQVREAEAARQRYEAAQAQYQRDLARNQEEVRRAQAAQADYERRMARRQARADAHNARHASRSGADSQGTALTAVRDAPPAADAGATAAAPVAAASEQCQDQRQRARHRGRAIGGVIGGVAGGVLGRGSTLQRLATIALAAPVGALIGDAIASHLDCHEQRQAAAATERVVERGVGATETWTSETRPNVTGSSTVTASLPADDGQPCVTVTDIIIVDGQETRAPKRMCRRPPSNRYVRV